MSHIAIAGVGLLVIAPGSPGAGDLPARMAYVAGHSHAWLAAWLVPPIASTLLLWLSTELRALLDRAGADTGLAFALAAVAAGVAIEGFSCALAAGALPELARTGSAEGFAAAERVVQLGISTFGNGPFSLAQILFTRRLARAGAPRHVVLLGYLTAAAGSAFMAAGATGIPAAITVCNAALLLALSAFAIFLARSPLQPAGPPA